MVTLNVAPVNCCIRDRISRTLSTHDGQAIEW